MKHTYSVSGMTCQGCVASVKEKLQAVLHVQEVEVDLEKGEANISMQQHIPVEMLRASLPKKYSIAEKGDAILHEAISEETSKWKQLRPLFLIFAYLFAAAILLNYRDWHTREAMLDFMGLFYIVFSFFKFLDLRGFPESFRMYDPLAKAVPAYGWTYPFLELGLGQSSSI